MTISEAINNDLVEVLNDLSIHEAAVYEDKTSEGVRITPNVSMAGAVVQFQVAHDRHRNIQIMCLVDGRAYARTKGYIQPINRPTGCAMVVQSFNMIAVEAAEYQMEVLKSM